MSPCAKFEHKWLRNKKVTKKPHFPWNEWEIRELKLEMTSYLDNAFDVTNKKRENAVLVFMRNLISVKPGLHIVTTAQHARDLVLKRVLKQSAYRLQIFLVEYEYLRSLRLCKDQGIRGKLTKPVRKHILAILTTYMRSGIKLESCSENVKEGRFQKI